MIKEGIRIFDRRGDALKKKACDCLLGSPPYGLTWFAQIAKKMIAGVESAMILFNRFGIGHPETPSLGMRNADHGLDVGSEAIEPYMQAGLITMAEVL